MSKNKFAIDRIIINILGYFVVTIISLLCLLPFYIVLSGSFTDNGTIIREGFGMIPKKFSLEAYNLIFKSPEDLIRAYINTIFTTIVGTVLALFITTMAAYSLSVKEFKYRNRFAFYFFFTTIFNGGMVPWYILLSNYLHIGKVPYIALTVPFLANFFNLIIFRSFISGLPVSIRDSAKIDGANDFRIYFSFVLPLIKPALATVGLFIALEYWNSWYFVMLFVKDDKYYTLQYFLYRILNNIEYAVRSTRGAPAYSISNLPSESYKFAMTIIATGPAVLIYPFLQKYFIKGITIGAVKG